MSWPEAFALGILIVCMFGFFAFVVYRITKD